MCLGYFGCMHLGHIELLQRAKRRAAERNAKVALFTFSNNHLKLLGKDDKIIYTYDERIKLYEKLGVDYVVSAVFDEEFRAKTGRQFVDILRNYDLQGVVCGFDYSCGSDRTDSRGLRELLADTCDADIVDAVCIDGVKVSTTLVRKLLASDKIEEADNLLSEPYFICGTVCRGRQVGRKLGFPTANISVDNDKFVPIGVFGGYAAVDGKSYKAIVNIGQKPTFALNGVDVEAHLIDFEGDIYGKPIKISLTKYLRPIYRFDNGEQLTAQLEQDKESVINDQIRSER